MDIYIEEYFNIQLFYINKIESSLLNSGRAKHKEKFVETVEKYIELIGLEMIMENYCNIYASDDRLE